MSKRKIGHHFSIIDNAFILHFDQEVYKDFYNTIDFPSFEIIESNGSTFHYFKDKNNVYLKSYMNPFGILEDADPLDFEILDFKTGQATSNGYDYIFDNKLPYRLTNVEQLPGLYQKVNDQLYFSFYQAMKGIDLDSFEVLLGDHVGNVAKDKNHVYFRHEVVPEADPATFHFLEECFSGEYYKECDHTFYAVDKHHAYYIDTIARNFKVIKSKSLDCFRFEIHDKLGYALDKNYRYLFGKRTKIR
jgi:hypothetical protein